MVIIKYASEDCCGCGQKSSNSIMIEIPPAFRNVQQSRYMSYDDSYSKKKFVHLNCWQYHWFRPYQVTISTNKSCHTVN
jgi:hypothetical protein